MAVQAPQIAEPMSGSNQQRTGPMQKARALSVTRRETPPDSMRVNAARSNDTPTRRPVIKNSWRSGHRRRLTFGHKRL